MAVFCGHMKKLMPDLWTTGRGWLIPLFGKTPGRLLERNYPSKTVPATAKGQFGPVDNRARLAYTPIRENARPSVGKELSVQNRSEDVCSGC
jgi:hypothetical protein